MIKVETIKQIEISTPEGKMKMQQKEEMEALGVMLDNRGKTQTSMEHRLRKGEKKYYQNTKIYQGKADI